MAATAGLPPTAYALSLAIDPQTPGTLYLGTSTGPFPPPDMRGGLYKSIDGAASWSDAELGITECCIVDIAIDPNSPGTIYASWGDGVGIGGLYKSTSNGASWTAIGTDLPGLPTGLTIDPQNTGALYALSPAGLFRSKNGGANWTPVYSTGSIAAFALDPQNAGTIYAGVIGQDAGGVFKTVDAGSTWNETDAGIKTIPVPRLAVDPQNQGTIYGANGGKLLKTTDGGGHWIRGAVDAWKVVLDPQDSSTVYALSNVGQPAKSVDGGSTWSTLNLPLAAGDFAIDLAIDGQQPGTLFAATGTKGVWKSVDQGATWCPASSGLPQDDAISVLAISRSDPLTLYAGTSVDCSCGYLGDGLFKSTDGGASWIDSGVPGGSVYLVVIDPQDDATLYVGVSLAGGNALFKSADAGAHWDRISSGLPDGVYPGSLAIDAHNASILYIGTATGVLRSVDGGKTWTAISVGLPERYVETVAIDPRDSSTVYAGI